MGFMGLASNLGMNSPDASNPFGCTACFCYGHSNTCRPTPNFVKSNVVSVFDYDAEKWESIDQPVVYNKVLGKISAQNSFVFPQQYLEDQRYSYNQHLRFNLKVDQPDVATAGRLIISGVGRDATLIELETPLNSQKNPIPSSQSYQYDFRIHESHFEPEVDPVTFISVLNNVTSIRVEYTGVGQLDEVQLETAISGIDGDEANWVETCLAPERSPSGGECVKHYTFESDSTNPYQKCQLCECHLHSAQPCDAVTGHCKCEHNTCGAHCDTCCAGYHGDPLQGTSSDCKEHSLK